MSARREGARFAVLAGRPPRPNTVTDLLLSGLAGAGKSAAARRALEESGELAVAADFQSLYAALTLQQRGPDGRYPLRDERLLPLTEYLRRAVISGARSRNIRLVATNSNGNPARREFLLGLLGPGAIERVLDPGEDVVRARLVEPGAIDLSLECEDASGRWYRRP